MPTKKHRASHTPTAHHDRADGGTAFLPDPYDGSRAPMRTRDALAEELAEEFIFGATGGEETSVEARDQIVAEENGGPFVVTKARTEFAQGTDASNPITAERAPFPEVTRSPRR